MMKNTLFALLVTLVAMSGAQAQGIDFFEGSWEEALELAAAEDKLIFVDGYAAWCGPCKRMARDVFPQATVGSYFNDNFVSVKMDMEKGQGIDFRKKYPVRAFPTLFFISPSGKVVLKETGARKANDLITLGKTAMSKSDQTASFQKLYDEGDRSYATVYNLVKGLNKASKPSLAIANEYINAQSDLTTEDHLRFLLEATTEADSRIFDLTVENRDAIIALQGKEAYEDKLYKAGMRTIAKSAEFQSQSLYKATLKKMKKQIPSRYKEFSYYASLNYGKATGDSGTYLKSAKKYVKSDIGNDARKLHRLSQEMVQQWNTSDSDVLDYAAELSKTAATNGGSSIYYHQWATVQYLQGNKDAAVTTLEKAITVAREEKANPARIEALLAKIKAEN